MSTANGNFSDELVCKNTFLEYSDMTEELRRSTMPFISYSLENDTEMSSFAMAVKNQIKEDLGHISTASNTECSSPERDAADSDSDVEEQEEEERIDVSLYPSPEQLWSPPAFEIAQFPIEIGGASSEGEVLDSDSDVESEPEEKQPAGSPYSMCFSPPAAIDIALYPSPAPFAEHPSFACGMSSYSDNESHHNLSAPCSPTSTQGPDVYSNPCSPGSYSEASTVQHHTGMQFLTPAPQTPIVRCPPVPDHALQSVGTSIRMLITSLRTHQLVTGVEVVPKKRNVIKISSSICADKMTVLNGVMQQLEGAEFICGAPRLGRKDGQIKLRFFDVVPTDPNAICESFCKKGKCKWTSCQNLHPRTCAAVVHM